jgi:hypothetical protein
MLKGDSEFVLPASRQSRVMIARELISHVDGGQPIAAFVKSERLKTRVDQTLSLIAQPSYSV